MVEVVLGRESPDCVLRGSTAGPMTLRLAVAARISLRSSTPTPWRSNRYGTRANEIHSRLAGCRIRYIHWSTRYLEAIRMKHSVAISIARQPKLTVAPQSPCQLRSHPAVAGCQPVAAASTNSEALPPDAVVSAQRLRSQKKEVVPEASVTKGISGPLRLASAMRSFRS